MTTCFNSNNFTDEDGNLNYKNITSLITFENQIYSNIVIKWNNDSSCLNPGNTLFSVFEGYEALHPKSTINIIINKNDLNQSDYNNRRKLITPPSPRYYAPRNPTGPPYPTEKDRYYRDWENEFPDSDIMTCESLTANHIILKESYCSIELAEATGVIAVTDDCFLRNSFLKSETFLGISEAVCMNSVMNSAFMVGEKIKCSGGLIESTGVSLLTEIELFNSALSSKLSYIYNSEIIGSEISFSQAIISDCNISDSKINIKSDANDDEIDFLCNQKNIRTLLGKMEFGVQWRIHPLISANESISDMKRFYPSKFHPIRQREKKYTLDFDAYIGRITQLKVYSIYKCANITFHSNGYVEDCSSFTPLGEHPLENMLIKRFDIDAYFYLRPNLPPIAIDLEFFTEWLQLYGTIGFDEPYYSIFKNCTIKNCIFDISDTMIFEGTQFEQCVVSTSLLLSRNGVSMQNCNADLGAVVGTLSFGGGILRLDDTIYTSSIDLRAAIVYFSGKITNLGLIKSCEYTSLYLLAESVSLELVSGSSSPNIFKYKASSIFFTNLLLSSVIENFIDCELTGSTLILAHIDGPYERDLSSKIVVDQLEINIGLNLITGGEINAATIYLGGYLRIWNIQNITDNDNVIVRASKIIVRGELAIRKEEDDNIARLQTSDLSFIGGSNISDLRSMNISPTEFTQSHNFGTIDLVKNSRLYFGEPLSVVARSILKEAQFYAKNYTHLPIVISCFLDQSKGWFLLRNETDEDSLTITNQSELTITIERVLNRYGNHSPLVYQNLSIDSSEVTINVESFIWDDRDQYEFKNIQLTNNSILSFSGRHPRINPPGRTIYESIDCTNSKISLMSAEPIPSWRRSDSPVSINITQSVLSFSTFWLDDTFCSIESSEIRNSTLRQTSNSDNISIINNSLIDSSDINLFSNSIISSSTISKSNVYAGTVRSCTILNNAVVRASSSIDNRTLAFGATVYSSSTRTPTSLTNCTITDGADFSNFETISGCTINATNPGNPSIINANYVNTIIENTVLNNVRINGSSVINSSEGNYLELNGEHTLNKYINNGTLRVRLSSSRILFNNIFNNGTIYIYRESIQNLQTIRIGFPPSLSDIFPGPGKVVLLT